MHSWEDFPHSLSPCSLHALSPSSLSSFLTFPHRYSLSSCHVPGTGLGSISEQGRLVFDFKEWTSSVLIIKQTRMVDMCVCWAHGMFPGESAAGAWVLYSVAVLASLVSPATTVPVQAPDMVLSPLDVPVQSRSQRTAGPSAITVSRRSSQHAVWLPHSARTHPCH